MVNRLPSPVCDPVRDKITKEVLAHALPEICCAHREGNREAEFIIDSYGRLWDASSGIGYLVSLKRKISGFIFSRAKGDGIPLAFPERREDICNGMRFVCNVLNYSVADMQGLCERTGLVFEKVCRGEVPLSCLDDTRSSLDRWESSWGSFFYGASREQLLENLKHEFTRFSPQGASLNVSDDIFVVVDHARTYHNALRIGCSLNYGRESHNWFPACALRMAGLRSELSHEQESELRDFVRRLKIFQGMISSGDLWQLFVSIATHDEQPVDRLEIMRRVVSIAEQLESYGLMIFNCRDERYFDWVARLICEYTTKVILESKVIKMMGLVTLPRGFDDKHLVFAIEGDINHMLVVSTLNPFYIARNYVRQHEKCWGLPVCEVKQIGRCGMLVERMDDHPHEHEWPGSEADFSEEDRKRLAALSSFIDTMIELNSIPEGLSPTTLMFNMDHEVRFLKPVARKSFDCVAVENFIWGFSLRHSYIYTSVMSSTRLRKHRAFTFYKVVFERTLQGQRFDIVRLALCNRIGEREGMIVGAARKLQADVVKIRESCVARLLHDDRSLDERQTRAKVVALMRTEYDESFSGHILMPGMKRRIVEKLRNKDHSAIALSGLILSV